MSHGAYHDQAGQMACAEPLRTRVTQSGARSPCRRRPILSILPPTEQRLRPCARSLTVDFDGQLHAKCRHRLLGNLGRIEAAKREGIYGCERSAAMLIRQEATLRWSAEEDRRASRDPLGPLAPVAPTLG